MVEPNCVIIFRDIKEPSGNYATFSTVQLAQKANILTGIANTYCRSNIVDYGTFLRKEYNDFILDWDALLGSGDFTKRIIGQSNYNHNIFAYEMGNENLPVVLWTFVMHGWEWRPIKVALEFFRDMIYGDNMYLKSVKTRYRFVIVPVINPTGYQDGTRENRDGLDINRDAINLVTPEGQALNSLLMSLGTVYQFIDFHSQDVDVSNINFLPHQLRHSTYNNDAIKLVASWRDRVKATVDVVDKANAMPINVTSRSEPTAGIFTEWAMSNGIIERFTANPEMYNTLAKMFNTQCL